MPGHCSILNVPATCAVFVYVLCVCEAECCSLWKRRRKGIRVQPDAMTLGLGYTHTYSHALPPHYHTPQVL
jgi:hypothetical protein